MNAKSVRQTKQIAALAVLVGGAAVAGSDPWDWRTLEMSARSGFFMSGKVKMRIDRQEGLTRLDTTTSARLFGAQIARSRTESILDPATGHAREYFSFSPKRGRHYIFGETGYVVKKLKPREGYDAPIDGWDVTSEQEFAYPVDGGGSVPVFDPYGMLLNLKRLELNRPGDQAVTHVATSKGPKRYTIRVGESRTRKRSYRDAATRKRRTIETEEFLLQFEPDADAEDEKGLLGMRGSIQIWVEARSKTLIRVSGKVPDVPGHVILKLNAMG